MSVAARTPTGTKVHDLYVEGSSQSNCGLKARRWQKVDVEQVRTANLCEKCFARLIAKRAEETNA